MKFFFLVLSSILAVALQLTWVSKLAFPVSPNLILAGILAFALCQKDKKKYWWALIPVLALDLLAGRPFGVFSLSAFLAFFSVELLAEIVFKKNDWPAILLLVAAGLLSFEFYQFLLIEVFSVWQIVKVPVAPTFYFFAGRLAKLFCDGLLVLLGLWAIRNSRKLFPYDGRFAKIK